MIEEAARIDEKNKTPYRKGFSDPERSRRGAPMPFGPETSGSREMGKP